MHITTQPHKSCVYIKDHSTMRGSALPFDVFVPSKKRPSGRTFDLLRHAHIPFTVFVEKEDEDIYRETLPYAGIVVLPKSNRGIGYARECIRTYATRPFVMMDDDITKLYKHTMDGTLRACSLRSALKRGWGAYVAVCNQHGLLGFKHTTFNLKSPAHCVTYDTTVAHILFMNPRDDISYNPQLKAFEDIDMMFKHRIAHMPIVRLNTIVYFTTPSGTNVHGGVDYTVVQKERELRKLIKQYPTLIRHVEGQQAHHNQVKYELTWKRRKTM